MTAGAVGKRLAAIDRRIGEANEVLDRIRGAVEGLRGPQERVAALEERQSLAGRVDRLERHVTIHRERSRS
jgi:hypothetical protein